MLVAHDLAVRRERLDDEGLVGVRVVRDYVLGALHDARHVQGKEARHVERLFVGHGFVSDAMEQKRFAALRSLGGVALDRALEEAQRLAFKHPVAVPVLFKEARCLGGEPQRPCYQKSEEDLGHGPKVVGKRQGVFGLGDVHMSRWVFGLLTCASGSPICLLTGPLGWVSYLEERKWI